MRGDKSPPEKNNNSILLDIVGTAMFDKYSTCTDENRYFIKQGLLDVHRSLLLLHIFY